MGRFLWPLALVGAFILGLASGSAMRPGSPAAQQKTVERLQQQIATLQAQLHGGEDSPRSAEAPEARRGFGGSSAGSFDRIAAAIAETPWPRAPRGGMVRPRAGSPPKARRRGPTLGFPPPARRPWRRRWSASTSISTP